MPSLFFFVTRKKQIINLLEITPNRAVYNKLLKKIGKKAGLKRMIVKKDNKGDSSLIPIYSLLSTHLARKNFISNSITKFKAIGLLFCRNISIFALNNEF
jgi:hypothetical protein